MHTITALAVVLAAYVLVPFLVIGSIRKKTASSSLVNLCEGVCTCGTFKHPVEAATNGHDAQFAAYPSSVEDGRAKLFSKWSVLQNPGLNFEYPVTIIFCQRLRSKRFPMEPMVTSSPAENLFFSEISALVLRQGNLEEVLREDLQPFHESVEYVDLSYNQITYIEPDAIVDLIKLQEIDLRFNKLHHLGARSWESGKMFVLFEAVGGNRNFLSLVRLRGNPLICSCGLARTIVRNVVIPSDDASSCYINKSTEAKNGFLPSSYINIARQTSQTELIRNLCRVDDVADQPRATHSNIQHSPQAAEHAMTDSHRDMNKFIMRSLSASQKHHIADSKLNISLSHGGADVHYEDHSNAVHRVYKNREVDIPLLVTMTAWFIMIYFGIVRFIKANSVERNQHVAYLRTLDVAEESDDDIKA